MSKVTGKDCIAYFEANREYFPSKFTVETVKHHLLNGDDTPAEFLHRMERKIERIRANRLAKAQEQAVQEEAAKFNEDLEAKQELVNEVNEKAEAAQNLIDSEVQDPVEVSDNNKPYELIQGTDLHEKFLFIKFARGSKTLFKDIKPVIVEKLNQMKPISDIHVKLYYKVDGKSCPTPKTICLDNNSGMATMKQLLDGDTFQLMENVYNRDDERTVLIVDDDPSNSNKDNPNALTIDMLTGIEIFHKSLQYRKGNDKCVSIYCYNGGSFYNYKINDEFKYCKPLLDKLYTYQITNDLTDKMFDMNCITYALQQSGKFEQKTIDNIKVNSYAIYVSHKDLDK